MRFGLTLDVRECCLRYQPSSRQLRFGLLPAPGARAGTAISWREVATSSTSRVGYFA